MVHGTAVLKSEYDGLGLSVLWVVPNEGTKGVVQISHGMSENKERYLYGIPGRTGIHLCDP